VLEIVTNEDEARRTSPCPRGAVSSSSNACAMAPASRSPSKRAISAAAEFPDLLSAPLERESLFAFLERKYKVEIGYADEENDATAADHRIADLPRDSLRGASAPHFVSHPFDRRQSDHVRSGLSTDLNVTALWSADSARSFRWWI